MSDMRREMNTPIKHQTFFGSVASAGYIFLHRIPGVKQVIDAGIRASLPTSMHISEENVTLFLNPKDAPVSGAIFFGVYEPFEVSLFRSFIRPQMTILDIGANLGYYTIIGAARVGERGRVIAFEPDTENLSFLQKNISHNSFQNVEVVPQAVSSSSEEKVLYLCSDNKGDHRLYPTKSVRKTVPITTTTVDEVLQARTIPHVDLVKMDIQGAEGLALQGMKRLLTQPEDIIFCTEFWPEGLAATGVDAHQFLETFVTHGFSLFHIEEAKGKVVPITDIRMFASSFVGRQYTNIVCVKGTLLPILSTT